MQQTTTFLGGLGISTVEATLICAILAAVISITAILSNRRVSKKSTTYNHITSVQWDKDYIAARTTYANARDSAGGLIHIISAPKGQNTGEKSSIISILNHHEIVALCINHGVFDEGVYKEYFRSSYIADWTDSQQVVMHLRKRNPKAFIHFEKLAKRWQK